MSTAISPTEPAPEPVSSPTRAEALVDIGVFVAASAAVFGVEELLKWAGAFPYPGLFDGAPTLIASFFVVMAIIRRRGQTWRHLGLRRPARWWHVPVLGLAVIVANVLAQLTVVPVVAALTHAPEPDLGRYDAIGGNVALLVVCTLGTMITGGFIEEVIYRGLMVDRLARIFGGGRRGLVLGALLCGVPFGLVHFTWGIGGILVTTVMGSVMGLLYLATRRNLWPLVAGHATLDAILMLQAYFGVLG